jgi:methylenetetrahydrofolate reductase (NADPH)
MRIDELLRQGRTWSFEFFPPKTPTGEREFNAAIAELSGLAPSYVSVTYGALGGVRHLTRDVVLRINREHDYPAMPHLTCVGHTRAELEDLLRTYSDGGVQNILALAGDPIDGDARGDFRYATELVELIRETGEFSVAVAAFPEGHPHSRDLTADRMRLADKLAMADFGLTQFFFDVDSYRRMVDDLTALGCDTPVIPGVMPFVSVAGTYRMAQMNGTSLPAELRARMDRVSGDPDATRRLGVDVASELVAQLLDVGVPGIHLYAMNRAASIREIYANLGLRPSIT